MKVTIIDYGMGNLFSVDSAVNYLGYKSIITNKFDNIANAKHLILPGVGSFKKAMKIIKEKKIDKAIKLSLTKNSKVLGICLGFQLLTSSSTEDGFTRGLSLIDKNITIIKKNSKIKIPHVGFNSVKFPKKTILFNKIKDNSDFYFVHSYKLNFSRDDKYNFSTFTHGSKYIAAFEYKNIFGTQFHPEKSQSNGLQLIKNFLEL